MTSEGTKRCTGPCGEEKPLSAFHKHSGNKNGRQHDCMVCHKAAFAEWSAQARRLDKKGSWARSVLSGAKQRASTSGLECTITAGDIRRLAGDVCPVFGIPLRYPTPEDAYTPRRNHQDAPTVDRIRPMGGYTATNIAVISRRANTIKNNASPEELRAVADWLDAELQRY